MLLFQFWEVDVESAEYGKSIETELVRLLGSYGNRVKSGKKEGEVPYSKQSPQGFASESVD
jgi:hypothetical protein